LLWRQFSQINRATAASGPLGLASGSDLKRWLFRSTSESKRQTRQSACLLRATFGLTRRSNSVLFDHLVGAGKKGVRNLKAKRLGRLEIEHKLEFCRLNDRQSLGLLAFQNSPDIDARLMIHLERV